MKHIRIPVTMGPQEAGWFGYLYMWQGQPNGAVGTRLQMNDPRDFRGLGQMKWEDPIGTDALAGDKIVPLMSDADDIMHDYYPHLRQSGSLQEKQGRQWVFPVQVHKA